MRRLLLIVAATSFCGYFALLLYCDLVRPVNPGFAGQFDGHGGMQVRHVQPGSPSDLAGLEVGDRLLTFNGMRLASRDIWLAALSNVVLDRPMPLEVERAGVRIPLALHLPPAPPQFWLSQAGAVLLAVRAAQLVMLVVALIVAFRRPADPAALIGAWLLATCAVFTIAPPFRLGSVWRALPILAGAAMWPPFVSSLAIGSVLLTFAAVFPRQLGSPARIAAIAWLPTATFLYPTIVNAWAVVYRPQSVVSAAASRVAFILAMVAAIAAALILVVINYRRLDDVNERRRLKIVVAGHIIGVVPGLPIVVSYWLGPSADLSRSLFESKGLIVAAFALLAAPLSLAYGILRHRLFDVSVIIRRGVRYAFARNFVRSLVPLLFGALLVDVWRRSDLNLGATIGSRGLLYAAMGGMAVLAYTNRRQWLEAIDRRFFRDSYNAQRLVFEVIDDCRHAASLEAAAPAVVAKIEAALHPEFAAMMVFDGRQRAYRTLAASPVGQAPPPLPADSKVVAIARVIEQPIDVSAETGPWRQLPPAEVELLARARIELLVPLLTSAGRLEAIVVLGPKRSEEPYGEEDRVLLSAVAGNLDLLAERRAPEAGAGGLSECLRCGTVFDEGTAVCDHDGDPLVERSTPRLLAGRYRIFRALRSGGMGTVYVARDTALHRSVAVKVIRDEGLIGNGHAAERFCTEARLAASLAHPNIVTIHDFGLIDGRLPFLVMELLSGETLRDALQRSAKLAAEQALGVLDGVCAAVDAAHRKGLIHRDLKPENIFLVTASDTRPLPKVLDFGLAKSVAVATGSLETDSGTLIGTPRYMAPERLRAFDVGPPADLWSLAVIAYEMLTGTVPFDGIVSDDFEVEQFEAVPIKARAFFARALSVHPAARPSSARAFAVELREALAQP